MQVVRGRSNRGAVFYVAFASIFSVVLQAAAGFNRPPCSPSLASASPSPLCIVFQKRLANSDATCMTLCS